MQYQQSDTFNDKKCARDHFSLKKYDVCDDRLLLPMEPGHGCGGPGPRLHDTQETAAHEAWQKVLLFLNVKK
jgi:hypothetical protein